jgi:hypothetical protein
MYVFSYPGSLCRAVKSFQEGHKGKNSVLRHLVIPSYWIKIPSPHGFHSIILTWAACLMPWGVLSFLVLNHSLLYSHSLWLFCCVWGTILILDVPKNQGTSWTLQPLVIKREFLGTCENLPITAQSCLKSLIFNFWHSAPQTSQVWLQWAQIQCWPQKAELANVGSVQVVSFPQVCRVHKL